MDDLTRIRNLELALATTMQYASSVDLLRARIGTAGQVMTLAGYDEVGDCKPSPVYWDPNDNTGDNGGTIFVPTDPQGRWVRMTQGEEEIHASWFGVKGDGSDATNTSGVNRLQNALDYMASLTWGGILRLPTGRIGYTKTPRAGNRTHVKGSGMGRSLMTGLAGNIDPAGSIALGTDTYAAFAAIGAHHVRFSEFTVDHREYNTHANGIVLVPTGRPEDVEFDHTGDLLRIIGHGIPTGRFVYLTGGTPPVGLANNTTYYWISVSANEGKLASSQVNALAETAISFSDNGSGATTLCIPYGGRVCTDCEVDKVELLGTDFHEYLIWNMRAQRTKIHHNTVDGGQVPDGTGQGEGIEVFGGHEVEVDHNHISRMSNGGILIGAATSVDDADLNVVIVEANEIDGCAFGVLFAVATDEVVGPQAIRNVKVVQNIITNTLREAVWLSADGFEDVPIENVEIDDNIVHNSALAYSGAASIRMIGCLANLADGMHKGIKARRNRILNGSADVAGIYATYFPEMEITDNDVENAFQAWRVQATTGTKIKGNKGKNLDDFGCQYDGLVGCDIGGNKIDGADLTGIAGDDLEGCSLFDEFVDNIAPAAVGILLSNAVDTEILAPKFRRPEAVAGYDVAIGSGDRSLIAGERFLYDEGADPSVNLGTNPRSWP